MIAVLALSFIILTACQSPSSSSGAKDGAKGNEAVKVVCENGVMLESPRTESHPSKASRMQNLL